MRNTLLKFGGLRRLLGFWASDAKSKWNEFSDMTFVENATPELGLPSGVDDRFQSPFEELWAARREKQYREAEPSYTFLLEAISILIRGSGLDEKAFGSPFCLKGNVKELLGEYERSVLTNPTLINKLISDSKGNLAITAMSEALIHISWENESQETAVLSGIAVGIGESEWDDLKKLFYFLKEWLKHKEVVAHASSIDKANKIVLEGIKGGKSAFYATLYAIKYLLALAQEVPSELVWYKDNIDKWEWLFVWMENNSYPSFESKETRPFRSREKNMSALARGSVIVSAEEKASWSNHIDTYSKYLESLKKGNKPETNDEIGRIDSLYYEKFLKEQIVECNDIRTQTWERGVVRRVLDEMIYLQPEYLAEKYAEWVEVEANNVAKGGTHTKAKEIEVENKDLYSSDDSPLGEEPESK